MLTARTIANVYSEHNLTENEIYANLLKANSETVIQVAEVSQDNKDAAEALTIYIMALITIKGSFGKEDIDDNIEKVISVLKKGGFKFHINNLLGAFRVITPDGKVEVFIFENITMKSIFKFIIKN